MGRLLYFSITGNQISIIVTIYLLSVLVASIQVYFSDKSNFQKVLLIFYSLAPFLGFFLVNVLLLIKKK